MTRRFLFSLAILALIAAPALAGGNTIYSGADLWATGQTYTNFKLDPLPQDFFCPGSQPFDGQINLKGEPLATEPECILGAIDTVINRLDDVSFDDEGNASTLIQFMALSLTGTQPLGIAGCGLYDVTASLDGEQPVTAMRIARTSEYGGTFMAPLHLNVKMVFTPRGEGEPLSVRRGIRLGPGTNSVWSEVEVAQDYVPVKVDTDGDRVADTMLPAPSNFAAGNIVPGNVLPENVALAAQAIPFCYTTNPPRIECENGAEPELNCHCTPWSQNPTPLTTQENCPGYPDDIDVCHLHCTWTCPPVPVDEEPVQGTL